MLETDGSSLSHTLEDRNVSRDILEIEGSTQETIVLRGQTLQDVEIIYLEFP